MSETSKLPIVAAVGVVFLAAAGAVLWSKSSRFFESDRDALIRKTVQRIEEAMAADGRGRGLIATDSMVVQFLTPLLNWNQRTLLPPGIEVVVEGEARLRSYDCVVFADANGNGAFDEGEPMARWQGEDKGTLMASSEGAEKPMPESFQREVTMRFTMAVVSSKGGKYSTDGIVQTSDDESFQSIAVD